MPKWLITLIAVDLDEGRTWGRTEKDVGRDGYGQKKYHYTIGLHINNLRTVFLQVSRYLDVFDGTRPYTPEHVVLDVGEGLTGRYDDRLARVNSQRIHVLHVAHRDAIPRAITHDLRGRSWINKSINATLDPSNGKSIHVTQCGRLTPNTSLIQI